MKAKAECVGAYNDTVDSMTEKEKQNRHGTGWSNQFALPWEISSGGPPPDRRLGFVPRPWPRGCLGRGLLVAALRLGLRLRRAARLPLVLMMAMPHGDCKSPVRLSKPLGAAVLRGKSLPPPPLRFGGSWCLRRQTALLSLVGFAAWPSSLRVVRLAFPLSMLCGSVPMLPGMPRSKQTATLSMPPWQSCAACSVACVLDMLPATTLQPWTRWPTMQQM